MKRVAIYMRVSSDKQVQEGESIPAQRDALRKYIDAHDNMVCAGEYLDDGISGTKEDRDELQRMLSDVREGKIDLILVTKLDRLYRSIRHYLNLQDTLDQCGVDWIAIWEPIYDTSTPQGRLVINQMMSFSQFEAEITGQRIRQVQAYKVAQGEVISGSTPPGLSIVGKRLVPNVDAPIVREMFEHYSRYGNMDLTIRTFDHHGIFPRTKPAYKAILKNTKYIGSFRGNDRFCEPIIDRDLFEDVQRKLSMNVKVSQREVYLFSGLLKCAECGRSLGGSTRRMKNGRPIHQHRYRCVGYYGSVRRCGNKKLMDEAVLERYLLESIRPTVQKMILTAEATPAQVKDNSSRISALEKRLSKMKELFVNDLISIDEYKAEREAIQSEISLLASESHAEPFDVSALRELLSKPFESLYNTFSKEDKRFFWRSIIREIRFGADRQVEISFLP